MVLFQEAEIVRNFEVKNDFYIIEIHTPEIARLSLPGQFIMISLSQESMDPLLPRAFSMARRTRDTLVFIYKVIGRGTGILAGKRPGDRLHIWGPLGNGFILEQGEPVLIGGGTGIAPLIDFGEELDRAGTGFTLVCGGRTEGDLKFMDEFRGAGSGGDGEGNAAADYVPYTEDGSLGERGYVTEFIENGGLNKKSVIYSCGPLGMLRRVGSLAEERGLKCYLSIETPMACGLGTCLGCAVPMRNGGGYFKACTDGPVFDSREVII